MDRRTFLLALGYLCANTAWAQASLAPLASLLVGQTVDRLPAELEPDLQLLAQRMRALDEATLERTLVGWPEGEAAARRVILHLIDPWRACPFANPPGRPPAHRAEWGRPWR